MDLRIVDKDVQCNEQETHDQKRKCVWNIGRAVGHRLVTSPLEMSFVKGEDTGPPLYGRTICEQLIHALPH